ncbi:class D sortase [Bacillus sp. E214]|uniref:class D sortase n=1 Tax=Bacillus sp. E214 TaxID=2587156 RepID=UPI0021CD028C|nr:class D sortase [Bacillus sp. E214]
MIVKYGLPLITAKAPGPVNVEETPESAPVSVSEDTDQLDDLYKVYPKTGEKFGELIIPKISAYLPIIEGTDEDELEKGVGHYADSVLPGMKDNSVLSGHRDTVFRKLGQVGKGDELIVQTTAGTFTYKVFGVRIVDADDRTVIVPKSRPVLTVTTCYPFDYIGDAPQRYILSANLIKMERH